jgi:hypothetical protein
MAAALTFTVVVKDAGAMAALEATQRDIDRSLKTALVRGAERGAVPAVRRMIHSRSGRLSGSIVAKATARNVYLTSNLRGKARAVAGLINHGGTVRTPIRPKRRGKRRRALRLAPGVFRAVVTTPRHYRGQHFLERGVDSVAHRIEADLDREVRDALEGHARAATGA